MSATAPRRTLGTWDITGLGINCVVGSGIFLLPGLVAEDLGPAAVLAVVAAGGLAFVIALCFAEAGSRFHDSGGAYVYARAAFGAFIGFQVGWVAALAGIAAWGALANAWAVALSHFFPAVAEGWGQQAVIVAFMVALAVLNFVGAKPSARVSNVFSAVKIASLLAFVALGISSVRRAHFEPFAAGGAGGLLEALPEAVLLMMYAYLGFENLVVPAGEMKDPRRSLPRALLAIMAVVTALYLGVQVVAAGTLDDLPGQRNAVAVAAEAFLGPLGGGLIALAAVISITGVNAASALILPRRLYALARQGDLPPVVGWVHAVYGTPTVAVVTTHLLAGLVAVSGRFRELALLAVVGRLLQYIPTCLAVLVFRRRPPEGGGPSLRLPLGPAIPLLALGLCLWLLAQASGAQLLAGGLALATGLPAWLWLRRRGGQGEGPRPRR